MTSWNPPDALHAVNVSACLPNAPNDTELTRFPRKRPCSAWTEQISVASSTLAGRETASKTQNLYCHA